MDAILRNRVRQALPPRMTASLRRALMAFRSFRARGDAVWCPVCERSFGRFLPYNEREFAMCPGCGCLERHRLLWLFLDREADLFSKQLRLLHIAPEPQLKHRLQAKANLDYISGDLFDPEAMLKIDVTNINLPDASFDAVICSHVMEHVADDGKAMRELLRIVRPGGWGILDAPVDWSREDTFEDWTVTEPKDRERVFGQWDHVRIYGRTYPDLLAGAGWEVNLDPISLEIEEERRMGLRTKMDRIYFCVKPSQET
jgi:SAM-dependent methyltransferase